MKVAKVFQTTRLWFYKGTYDVELRWKQNQSSMKKIFQKERQNGYEQEDVYKYKYS